VATDLDGVLGLAISATGLAVVDGTLLVTVGTTVTTSTTGAATGVVGAGVLAFIAAIKPGHVGLLVGSVAQGSTRYFKLKLTLAISGPYGPAQ
jgi:hypothetical protein